MYQISKYNDLRELQKAGADVCFMQTKSGHMLHISINGCTYCVIGARPISFKIDLSTYIENEFICNNCFNTQYIGKTYWDTTWQCESITNKKKRCLRGTGDLNTLFCKQHKNGILAYLHKKFPLDLSKMIFKMLKC